MKRSPMPARTVPLASVTPLNRSGFTVIRGGNDGAAPVVQFPARSRPKDTIPAGIRAVVRRRDLGLCVHCGRQAEHIHHRRLKGYGGDPRPHTDCPCNLVCLCFEHHDEAHRERAAMGEPEGLIIPQATPLPRLLPVLVHGYEDGSGQLSWPTCAGEWLTFEPEGGGAA